MSNKNKKRSPLKHEQLVYGQPTDHHHDPSNPEGYIGGEGDHGYGGGGGGGGDDPNDPLTVAEQMENNPDYLMETGAANTQQQIQDALESQATWQDKIYGEDGSREQFEGFDFQNFFGNLENPYAGIQTEFDNLGAGYQNVTEGMQNVTQGMTSVMD